MEPQIGPAHAGLSCLRVGGRRAGHRQGFGMSEHAAGGTNAATAQGAADHHAGNDGHGGQAKFWTLLIGSIGVVYGDIGTSPLYAFKESLHHITKDDGFASRVEVLGIVSLIFWALMIVVTIKYVFLVLSMDNRGEGGTLSLMALAQRALGKRTTLLFIVGVVGASLFYGDAIITPAISVMSAVEGLREVKAVSGYLSQELVVVIAAVILVALFLVQSRGTGKIGRLFGPITATWFVVMGALGAWHLFSSDISVLAALSPHYAVVFALEHGLLTFLVLGSVFLAVTGAEALYADMGHFGRKPIRMAWVWLVLPCLTLNYLGQAALVLENPAAGSNPFFNLAPDGTARILLVLLAGCAAIIASQAVITGAFSLTQQAIQLGLLPRMTITRTNETQAGQIYLPQVNWMLLVGVLALTFAFGSSTELAAAYGISITGEMLMSTVMMFIVIWKLWKKPLWMAIAIAAPFAFIELVFLSSNLTKFLDGGFVPLLLALILLVVVWTWVTGTQQLSNSTRRDLPLDGFFETLALHPPHKVPGTAVFLTADSEAAPVALLHNLKHNHVLHEQIIILTIKTLQQPRVAESEMISVEDFVPGVKRMTMRFGFMDTPNVSRGMAVARRQGVKFDIMKTSFFVSRRTLLPSSASGMPIWQDHLFIFLARNATSATDFFHIPTGRVVELGSQVTV